MYIAFELKSNKTFVNSIHKFHPFLLRLDFKISQDSENWHAGPKTSQTDCGGKITAKYSQSLMKTCSMSGKGDGGKGDATSDPASVWAHSLALAHLKPFWPWSFWCRFWPMPHAHFGSLWPNSGFWAWGALLSLFESNSGSAPCGPHVGPGP